MINDFKFDHGKILAEKANQLTMPILNLKRLFYDKNWPVIYVNDHYNLWRADIDRIQTYCTNHRSEKIIRAISPCEQDYFLIKPKHSGFYGTALSTLLRQLEVDTLILTGIAGNICVLFTANDAYMREYNLIVPNDCIASNSDDDNRYALTMMHEVLKATINDTDEILHNLSS
jgi:nicotinamidase-related amidase